MRAFHGSVQRARVFAERFREACQQHLHAGSPAPDRVKTNMGFGMRRKLEGGVSAVTKQVNIADKYAKQLAELDLMAEDWVDTDEVSLPLLPLSSFLAPFLPVCCSSGAGQVRAH